MLKQCRNNAVYNIVSTLRQFIAVLDPSLSFGFGENDGDFLRITGLVDLPDADSRKMGGNA